MNRVAICLAGLLAFSSPPQSAKEIVRAVEARYSRARTLEAKFYERYRASGQPGQSESGTVYFSKPGRMRWDYESPQTKLFLVDGKNVWLYVPADRTASRAKLKESDDWRTPLALLTGKIHLDRLCGKIELQASAQSGASTEAAATEAVIDPRDRILVCSPPRSSAADGSDSPFRQIIFEIDPDYRLARVLISEPGDAETEFRFGNWQENVAVEESKFHFEPPPGVNVVNAEDLAQGIH